MQGNITDWGKEVKKGLIERGWSINDLAERIGKSRTRVSGHCAGWKMKTKNYTARTMACIMSQTSRIIRL